MIKADNERNDTRPAASNETMAQQTSAATRQTPYPIDGRPSSLQSQPSAQSTSSPKTNSYRKSFPTLAPSEKYFKAGARASHHSQHVGSHEHRDHSPSRDTHQSERSASEGRDSSLSDRFAKLRMDSSLPQHHDYGGRNSNGDRENFPGLSTDYSTQRDTPSLHVSSNTASRTSMYGQARPQIDTRTAAGLPKPPSPTYTPTKGTHDGVRFQPLRSSRSTNQTSYERPSSVASTTSSVRPMSIESHSASQDCEDQGNRRHPVTRRRRSINKPQETDVNADKLYDYLSAFNVLLIDVRSRSDFDSGHIFGRSVICIEPTALREYMSAEELQEALVLSPEDEGNLFDRRNEFDLVVYYDQSSNASEFGLHRRKHPNPALKYLNDALYDFNQEKPLQWPPILLNGGLDAWVDLLGHQTLLTSNTANRPRGTQSLPRRPVPGITSRIDIQKRRHREYNPLDPEEERKWRERARSESIVLDQRPHFEGHESAELPGNGMVSMPDYEDFANRFPDVATVEEQNRNRQYADYDVSRVPYYPTPQPPTAIPQSPKPPPHSASPTVIPPTVPARPPPAVPRRTYSGVSDRVSQPSAPTKPPKLAPYIPPRLRRIPRIGLKNFGVTCYMNATIQCMSATIPLTAYFLDGQFQRDIQRENWKGSKGIMAELYHTLLRNLWESTDVETIRPTNFRKFNARLNREWGLERQQDAKEYLEFLIDMLHEDLNVNYHRNPLRLLTEAEEAQRERMSKFVASKREWGRYEHRDRSRLTDYFAGQHLSRLQCNVCQHSSTTYEPFYSISVEIPNISRRPVDIADCLRSYCSAETLSGEEVWRCPRCKCDREATKRILITRVPENLVVHFKRFSASHAQSAKKITVPIDFPLTGLDLEPYVLAPPTTDESSLIAQQYGASELQTPGSMRPPYRYDCYAVMRHLGGTIASGHYIALVKDEARGVWREFNDDRVKDFHPEELSSSKRLQNEQAYILFYSRVRGTR